MNKYQEALNRILDDDYDFPHDFYGEDKATTKECDANIMQELVDKATLKKPNIWGDGYDDKDGKRVYVTEVVADSVQFLESKSAALRSVNMNKLTELAYKGGESLSVVKFLKENSTMGNVEITAHIDDGEELVFEPFTTLEEVILTFAKMTACFLTEKEILFVQASLMGCIDQIPSDDFVECMKSVPAKFNKMKELWGNGNE